MDPTRRVPAWRVAITLEADFCVQAVDKALANPGKPETFNTDRGSQFTSADFIKVLAARQIKISMDVKRAWRDNVFIERLLRIIKNEQVCLRACASLSDARAGTGRHIGFSNSARMSARSNGANMQALHSPLGGKTPEQTFQPAVARSRCGESEADDHPENARNLFRQTGSPLPVAMGTMDEVAKRYGPSPKAFLLITLAGSFFVDLANAFIAKGFLALPFFAITPTGG